MNDKRVPGIKAAIQVVDSWAATTGSFTDALLWASGALEEGGEGVIIRWGNPR